MGEPVDDAARDLVDGAEMGEERVRRRPGPDRQAHPSATEADGSVTLVMPSFQRPFRSTAIGLAKFPG